MDPQLNQNENPPIVNIPTPPPPPPPAKKPKFSLFILLVILLPIIGFIAYLYIQKSNPKPLLIDVPVTSPENPTPIPPTPFPTTFVTPIPIDNPISQNNGWKLFTNNIYKFTLQYPETWTLLQGSDSAGNHRISIFGNKTAKSNYDGRLLPELFITKISPFGEKGLICDKKFCTESPTPLQTTILGQPTTIPVFISEYEKVKNGERRFDFYTFSIQLPNNGLYAIASYKNPDDAQIISSILSTLSFNP